MIHAGYHKTGTTSIQVALTNSRARLHAAGALYPRSGVPEEFPYGQHLLPWSVMKRPPAGRALAAAARERVWRDVIHEIAASNASLVILSSEEFDRLDRSEISTLARLFQDHDIVPVIFLRGQGDLVESMFRTHVIHLGYAAPIARFAVEEAPRLDFAQMVRDWTGIARDRASVIASYEDVAVRRDSVGVFMDAVGVDARLLAEDRATYVNTSAPAFVCELVREFRCRGVDEADVQQWVSQALRIDFGAGARTAFTCMPHDLSGALNRRYDAEASAIMADGLLKTRVRGTLARPTTSLRPETVVTAAQALTEFRNRCSADGACTAADVGALARTAARWLGGAGESAGSAGTAAPRL